ncbi:protein FAM187B-like [Lepus europaeus]|uniref:protein FAM187B-like n=1 Tax=Lepus europaeus TaxID=9983 RepID=UPI002B482628|nr:protein FAM187B-like [Lepus europaeus]
MLTTWHLLLGFTVPVLGHYVSITCPPGKVCQRALLSGSTILLHCNISGAQWYHFMQRDQWSSNISVIPNVNVMPGGSMVITKPLPSQTGIYYCRDKSNRQVTQYEIDFQDVSKLHLTHRGLGQKPLQNETLILGHKERVFTRWEPWQDCNRCKEPGERKRVGYCYIEVPLEEPVPCWLYLGAVKILSNRMRPELQVEDCQVQCVPKLSSNMNFVIFDNYRLNEGSGSTWLTCPLASIYRPVVWELDDSPLTWKGQLSGQDISTFLDPSTGGQQLQIFKSATYKCFVHQEFIARFNAQGNQDALGALRDRIKAEEALQGQPGPTLRRLALTLLVGTVLAMAALLLLLRLLCASRGKRSRQTLLVK